ncbi:MFS transporter [Micromonospora wenchangensis]|uniref:MFS transporter n=1 Tax=Micromonospora wenchangensis TaxID=1185415 RepID=UPI003D709BB9
MAPSCPAVPQTTQKGHDVHRIRGNPWAVLIALCMGFFMTLLDTTVVGVAIPDIVTRLGITYSEVLWVSNAYVLVLAALLIPGGMIGDRLGKRNVYLAGVAVFTLASALCSISQTAGQLVAARGLQGLGAAALIPQTISIIMSVFPPERRGAALGVWGAVAGVATVAGPPLGGLLVGALDWRWIFTINIPLGALVLVLAPMIIPAGQRPPTRGKLDLRGMLLLTAGLAALTYGLQEGQQYDWNTKITLVLALGVVLLAVFVVSQRNPGARQPVMPLGLLATRTFGLMNLSAVGLSVGIMSMAIGFQLYAQSVLGMSPLAAGAVSAPMSAVSVLLGPYAGRLSDRIGGRPMVFGGLAVFGLGLLAFALTSGPESTAWTLLPSMLLMGVGLGCTFGPLAAVAMSEVPLMASGSASGMLNATRQLGAVLGTAGFGVLLQNRLAGDLDARAVAAATTLPPEVRGSFISGVHGAANSGLDFGALSSGSAGLSPSMSHDLAAQVTAATREVFSDGYVAAMHTSLALPIAAVVLAALLSLFATRKPTVVPPSAPEPVPDFPPEGGVEPAAVS